MLQSWNLNLVDLTIIIIYFLLCFQLGVYNAKKIKTLQHFALGSGNISIATLLCIIVASSIGAGSIIGITEKIFLFGIMFVINQLLMPLQWLVAAKVIAPNIEKFKGCITISQIMYKLYGNAGRIVTNVASIAMGIGAIAVQASAIGFVFNYFLGIEFVYGILISYVVLTTYSLLGGIKAIIPTEIFKAIIFFAILPISYMKSSTDMGSIQEIFDKLPLSHINIDLTTEIILTIIGFVIFSLLPNISSPLIQRYLMSSGVKELRKTFIYLACLSLPFYVIICIIAYTMRAVAPAIPANEAFLYYIAHFLPVGIKGLMIAGLMAIIMAMAESWLNSTSVIIVNDIIKVRYPNINDTHQLLALRITVPLLSLFSVSIALGSKNILELIWFIYNFWDPIIAIPIYAGFLGLKANAKSFIVSIISAIICTLIGRLMTGEFALISLSFGMLGSAMGLFGAHYIQSGWNYNFKMNFKGINNIFGRIISGSKQGIINLIKKETEVHQPKFGQFCTVIFAYYIIYSFNLTTYHGHKIFVNILCVGYLLCLLLIFKDFIIPKKVQQQSLKLYWYFTITFCLPFASGYMLFISQNQDFWIVNSLICGFTLFFFVNAIEFLILCSIGTFGAFILFLFTKNGIRLQHTYTMIGLASYIYLFLTATALLFFRNKEKKHEEQVETMKIFGGAMAHEVRSPLASMTMGSEHLRDMFNNMDKIKEEHEGYYNIKISKEEYELMQYIGCSMHTIASKGIHTVDGLLVALKTNINDDANTRLSMKKTVSHIMKEYAMINEFASKVTINVVNDFNFRGSLHFIKHMLFNLLNNAHKYGGPNVKVEITIKKHYLYFKDNGKGISKEVLPYIFDKFFTSSKSGTGVGLAFCKLVMESMNGAIECQSQPGKYTLFILNFPKSSHGAEA